MKEKIKILMKNNIYNIVVILTILGAIFTFIIKEGKPILLFFLITPFFLVTIWFFSQDKQIKEFKETFNNKFLFLGKTLAVIFRIFIFLIFLFSIFIIVIGIIDTIEEIQAERIRIEQEKIKAEQQKYYALREEAYQKCLDKVANLTVWEPETYYFLREPIKTVKEVNKYFDEWIDAGRPNYNQQKGYWEIAFMIWMMQNYSSFCDEFNANLIKDFLAIKSKEVGIRY